MPTYGYRCRSCGHEFEIQQRMSDPALKTCPKCAGELGKIVYSAGIIYKGSGYYNTDYKSASKTEGQASEKSVETASDKGSDKGSEKGSETSQSNGATKASDGGGESKPAAKPKTESKAPKSDSTE